MNEATIEGLLTFSSTIGLASLILYCLTIDRLIRILREKHCEDWNHLGRPVGVFHIPPDAQWWQGMGAHLGLVCDALIRTPAWLAEKPDLLFLIKKVRWCIAVAAFSVISGLVLQPFSSSQ